MEPHGEPGVEPAGSLNGTVDTLSGLGGGDPACDAVPAGEAGGLVPLCGLPGGVAGALGKLGVGLTGLGFTFSRECKLYGVGSAAGSGAGFAGLGLTGSGIGIALGDTGSVAAVTLLLK